MSHGWHASDESFRVLPLFGFKGNVHEHPRRLRTVGKASVPCAAADGMCESVGCVCVCVCARARACNSLCMYIRSYMHLRYMRNLLRRAKTVH
jgi:hypothetical protein